jgi:hypothetical protein
MSLGAKSTRCRSSSNLGRVVPPTRGAPERTELLRDFDAFRTILAIVKIDDGASVSCRHSPQEAGLLRYHLYLLVEDGMKTG